MHTAVSGVGFCFFSSSGCRFYAAGVNARSMGRAPHGYPLQGRKNPNFRFVRRCSRVTDKELQKLNRRDLLELLLEQSRQIDKLKAELAQAQQQLEERKLIYDETRAIAAMAVRLDSGVHAMEESTQFLTKEAGSVASATSKLEQLAETFASSVEQYLTEVRVTKYYWERERRKAEERDASRAGYTYRPAEQTADAPPGPAMPEISTTVQEFREPAVSCESSGTPPEDYTVQRATPPGLMILPAKTAAVPEVPEGGRRCRAEGDFSENQWRERPEAKQWASGAAKRMIATGGPPPAQRMEKRALGKTLARWLGNE